MAVPSIDANVAGLLRGQVLEICIDTAFLVTGLTCCAIAALRRRSGSQVFLWLGVWSAAYGLLHLLGVRAVVIALPQPARFLTPYVMTVIVYSLLVVASSAWLTLIVGLLRRIIIVLVTAASATAVAGIGWFVFTGVNDKLMPLNNLLAACVLSVLIAALVSNRLFRKYLRLPDRGILVFGTLVFAIEALFVNLTRPLGLKSPILLDHLGFAALIMAFGYAALRMVFTNEHRLLSINRELEIARQIQASILPSAVPVVSGLRIAATYQPMTSVAGDFYEFLPVDDHHVGILVADVCGHGVPAALIASMLKVAVQSESANADDPGKLLAGLNRALAAPLRGQLVSAAYIWIDMAAHKAQYSAAGHPPLLRWHRPRLETVESNGLLFGVLPNCEYPVTEIPLTAGDRLLLYTDGIVEPENASGAAFGEARLPAVLERDCSLAASELSRDILSEIRTWQPTTDQQDDMTLVVIEVV